MSYESSMIYTMGAALSRALDERTKVSVLVNGAWLTGIVAVSDGTGVVLDAGERHWIIKVSEISAIQLDEPVPWAAPPVPAQGSGVES